MEHRTLGRKRMIVLVCVLLLLLLAVAVAAGWVGGTQGQQPVQSSAAGTSADLLTVDGKQYRVKSYLKTYLVMGIDKAGAEDSLTNVNNQQSDFNALVIVDLKNETYSILYLNRDTMTDVPVLALDGTPYTTRYEQLALAHTYGTGMKDSCENVVNTITALLGQDVVIDHYVAFYLAAIGTINDSVGGVTVTIEDDFTESDPTLVMGETVTLNASQAEHFVRSRMDVADGTNLNRMKRQMTYLTEWVDLATAKLEEDAGFATSLVSQLGDEFVTDLSVQQISDLADVFKDYTMEASYQLKGDAVKGEEYMEYYLDETALQQTVLKLFYDEK